MNEREVKETIEEQINEINLLRLARRTVLSVIAEKVKAGEIDKAYHLSAIYSTLRD